MTNARKSREKHRMEEKEIQAQQEAMQMVKEMADRNEVWLCSGTQVHNANCDGSCGFRVLDAMEVLINEEHSKWEELGMVPLGVIPQIGNQVPGVPIDILQTQIAVTALTEMCYELGMDKEKLNDKYRELFLERLITLREANQEAIIEARNRSVIMPEGMGRPKIIVPDHIARKM